MNKSITLLQMIIVTFLICQLDVFGQNKEVKKYRLSNYISGNPTNETILAKVGDKYITVREFYERAEYTVRPSYAKGKSEIEKKIILNSLIAEKLISIERGEQSSIHNSEEFRRIMLGRKEQVMRQLLFNQEGYQKVIIDSSEFEYEYKLAGRTYDIEFINCDFLEEADYVADQLKNDSVSVEDAYYELTGERKVPKHTIVWNSPEYPEISDLLFKNKVSPDQVFGPIKLPKSFLVFKVTGWIDKPAITETDQQQRFQNVKEKLRVEKGTKEFVKFIRTVMAGKTLKFNKDVFRKLVEIMAPAYQDDRDQTKEEFAATHLDKKNDVDKKFIQIENSLNDIADEALFTIDGQIWTVGMYEEERKKHPLVFASRDVGGKKFAKELKMAIVDLVHDKYLTEVAYERDMDNAFITKRISNMWSDALISFYEQIQLIKEKGANRSFTYENVNKFFTPYIDELQEKYSDIIEINIDEYKKLKLTSIDFVALQKNVPYPIIVPSFPQITTDYHLDYGRVMESQNKE